MSPENVLQTAGLAVPDAEMTVRTVEPERGQSWHAVVTFQAAKSEIDAWERASFGNPIETRAYKDDTRRYAEHVGEGVQKEGDRATSWATDSGHAAVVISQDDRPIVHVGVVETA